MLRERQRRAVVWNDRLLGRGLSTVLVQIVYKEPFGITLTLPVGAFALSTNWSPSLPMLELSVVQGVLSMGQRSCRSASRR